MMNKIFASCIVVFTVILFSVQTGCESKLQQEMPSVETVNASEITSTSLTSGGVVFSAGGDSVVSRGICASTIEGPTVSDLITIDGKGAGSFTSTLSGLTPETTYFIRSYATNSTGTSYGNQIIASTLWEIPVTLTTADISSITSTSAVSGGAISDDGGLEITARGVCWSTTPGPTIADKKSTDGTGMGAFVSPINGLTDGTTYYARAYATNANGTYYGNEISFVTISNLPLLKTVAIPCITPTTVSCDVSITSDGGKPVTARGVCWNTTAVPTIAHSKVNSGTGIGNFSVPINGLMAGTTYYARAFATNSAGTSYGNELSFKTTTLPPNCGTVTDIDGNVYQTVTIGTQCWMVENLKTTKYRNGDPITNITDNAAWASFNTGAYCWQNNDAAANKNRFGALYNWYSVSDNRKIAPVGWHVPTDDEWKILEAFLGISATEVNTIGFRGADQGGKLKQICLDNWLSPNEGASNSSGFTAMPGGYRHFNGSFDAIFAEAYLWSSTATDANNALARSLHSNSAFVGRNLHSNRIGFSVRCLAGEAASAPTIPILKTAVITNVSAFAANSGGNITSDGGASITAKGVCWSTNTNPTIANSKTNDGAGTGAYTSAISGLTAGTNYYVRAYATNVAGTAYGDEATFKTVCNIVTAPGTISGNSSFIPNATGIIYSISPVLGAINYNWTVPSGATIVSGQGTTSITVNFGINGGNIGVRAENSCGNGPYTYLTVTVCAVPEVPGPITGSASVAQNASGVVYSITAVPDATRYDWIVPAGATIVTGQGTTTITVNFGTTGDNIGVRAGNSCGNSAYNYQPLCALNSFTDSRDGKVYKYVQIGTQTWMAENLAYLPSVNPATDGSYTVPYNYVLYYDGTNVAAAKASGKYGVYGVLYNWPAAMANSASSSNTPSGVKGICPTGWHLPSDNEWTILTTYLGGGLIAAAKMKEAGILHWNSPNNGTNESCFGALPGGYRYDAGLFANDLEYGWWWSSTEGEAGKSWQRNLVGIGLNRENYSQSNGLSVRCVKDN